MSILFSNSTPSPPAGMSLVTFQADAFGNISAAYGNQQPATQVLTAPQYTPFANIAQHQVVALNPGSSSQVVPCTSLLVPIGIALVAGTAGQPSAIPILQFGTTSPIPSATAFAQGDWFAVNDSGQLYVPSLEAGQSVRTIGMSVDLASSPDVAIVEVFPGILYGPYNTTSPVNLTGQSAALSATTLYAIPTTFAGLYKISWAAKVTQPSDISSVLGGSGGFQVTYTDKDDSVTLTPLAEPSASGTGNATATQLSGSIIVNAKASTNIQYQFGYTDTHTITPMQYSLQVRIEYLG